MKFGGSSVADPDKIRHVAQRLVEARERGVRVVATVSAMGDTTDGLLELARQVSPRPASAGARHAPLHGRADRLRARRDGRARPRLRGRLVHGLAGGHHHRPRPYEGEDPRDHPGSRRRGARPRADRPRRRLPGLLARHDGRDHARPRRHRRDGSRARRRARCVVRDLLRRPRASSPRTRASFPTPASSSASPTRRCSRCRRRGRRCSCSEPWRSRATRTCPSTPARPSRTSPEPGCRAPKGSSRRSSRP